MAQLLSAALCFSKVALDTLQEALWQRALQRQGPLAPTHLHNEVPCCRPTLEHSNHTERICQCHRVWYLPVRARCPSLMIPSLIENLPWCSQKKKRKHPCPRVPGRVPSGDSTSGAPVPRSRVAFRLRSTRRVGRGLSAPGGGPKGRCSNKVPL